MHVQGPQMRNYNQCILTILTTCNRNLFVAISGPSWHKMLELYIRNSGSKEVMVTCHKQALELYPPVHTCSFLPASETGEEFEAPPLLSLDDMYFSNSN